MLPLFRVLEQVFTDLSTPFGARSRPAVAEALVDEHAQRAAQRRITLHNASERALTGDAGGIKPAEVSELVRTYADDLEAARRLAVPGWGPLGDLAALTFLVPWADSMFEQVESAGRHRGPAAALTDTVVARLPSDAASRFFRTYATAVGDNQGSSSPAVQSPPARTPRPDVSRSAVTTPGGLPRC